MKPTLIVVAGPNGAGKTTITEKLLRHEWMDGCVYINPDVIAQEEFGGWNSPEAIIKKIDFPWTFSVQYFSCLGEMPGMDFLLSINSVAIFTCLQGIL